MTTWKSLIKHWHNFGIKC